MNLKYCVYILYSQKDKLLYIGYTTDLEKRFDAHSKGHSKATASRRPFVLLFCEYYFSIKDAKRREGYFKTTAGKKALKIMLKESLAKLKNSQFKPLA